MLVPLSPGSSGEGHWRSRPVLAGALRLSILLVPIGASIGATVLLRRLVPEPYGLAGRVAWWAALAIVAVGVAVAVERLARRLLPLVALLKLGMLFPDQAPSRFAVARQAGSTQLLEEHLEMLRDDPDSADEASVAKTILALTVALQSHDRRTRGHAERVRVFTDLLAEELKLPEDDRYRLRWAALLHDVGKLRVKARILNKPGGLDEKEWEVIRRHPAEGARIAGSLLEWLGPWGDAIAQHHERYDGRGYPGGLSGEGISLAARIVSLADSYDTMTAARSYRKPMAVRAARQELAKWSGVQFDPRIVRAFFQISLPRLLWRTGPLSFVFHLPYLQQLEAIGRQSITAAGQTAAAATVASVTAVSLTAPVTPSERAPVSDRSASIELAAVDPIPLPLVDPPSSTPPGDGGEAGEDPGGTAVAPASEDLPVEDPPVPIGDESEETEEGLGEVVEDLESGEDQVGDGDGQSGGGSGKGDKSDKGGSGKGDKGDKGDSGKGDKGGSGKSGKGDKGDSGKGGKGGDRLPPERPVGSAASSG
jgi:putative nucleotidyltransferase with HDIG domain